MKKIFLYILIAAPLFGSAQQKRQTENLIIITLDGMRWQEVFNGADKELLANKTFTRDSADTWGKFWDGNSLQRRKKLFPFLWSEIEAKGQLHGNRAYNNFVNVANPYWFSYPGYNEIFTGFPDDSVNSNDKVWNPNSNVLEFINTQKIIKAKWRHSAPGMFSPIFSTQNAAACL